MSTEFRLPQDIRTRFYREQRPAAEAIAELKRANKAGDVETMHRMDIEKGKLIALGGVLGNVRKTAKQIRDEQDER
ncbi:hypothetical protein ACUHMQ_21085 [Chitinimonas sp. PSY-7]|uniref:hypothetical protein n=1 Tax=Chitinimonas sp. PSY-7 TaxID=3459088 RepID=UPI0040402928